MQLPTIPWYRHWWGLAAILAGAFILVSFVFAGFWLYRNWAALTSAVEGPAGAGGQSADPLLLYGNPLSPALGTSTSDIMIVEFADFACPHCAAAFPIVREIAAKHPDRVRFVFRNFPVITEHSLTLALAGFCANEQGKFWLLHDKIFLKQGIATEAELAELARAGGLDATKFAACLSAQKYLSAVQKDFEDGQSLGVTGTPTWFFNGTRVEGDIPRETFLMIIEELIK